MIVANNFEKARKYFDENEEYLSYGVKLSDFSYDTAAKKLAFSLIDVEKKRGIRLEFDNVANAKLNLQVRGRAFEPLREGVEQHLNLKDGYFALEDEWSGSIELKAEKIAVSTLDDDVVADYLAFNSFEDSEEE